MNDPSRTPLGPESGPDVESGSAEAAAEPIAGDRGIPSINRARSIQSRVTTAFALTLMGVLGFGLLGWYYTKALTRPLRAQHAAQEASRSRAQGEMPLPSLGAIHGFYSPKAAATPATTQAPGAAPVPGAASSVRPASSAAPSGAAPGMGMEQFLGPRPPPPGTTSAGSIVPNGMAVPGTLGTPPGKTPGQLAFERRLAGPAFARASKDASTLPQTALSSPSAEVQGSAAASMSGVTGGEPSPAASQGLSALLRPTVTPAVAASVLPTRAFLLAKGTFIDCTLETAIDSTLPGMTTCITATDTFSDDGTVVLLERGTKLVGETRGEVQQGTSRIFVLWSEARTPTGVVVPLSSPGTDELGRSGLEGSVNRHFWDRFGAAILLTVINGAVQGAVNSQNQGGSVVVSPSTSTDVMPEILRSTVSIPPTVTKRQGDRIEVFVARDVDFRSVYALRTAATERSP